MKVIGNLITQIIQKFWNKSDKITSNMQFTHTLKANSARKKYSNNSISINKVSVYLGFFKTNITESPLKNSLLINLSLFTA